MYDDVLFCRKICRACPETSSPESVLLATAVAATRRVIPSKMVLTYVYQELVTNSIPRLTSSTP